MNVNKKDLVFESIEACRAAMPQERWEAEGQPRMWCTVETRNGYEAQIDIGYGRVRVLKDGIVLAGGKNSAQFRGVVCLDREYYDVEKYLWF